MTYQEKFFSERKHSSEKWEHYFEIYDHLFSHKYGQDITYVEIGVQNGGSLEVAKSLFGQNSRIFGLDIDPKCVTLQEDGTAEEIFVGSQIDPACIDSLKQRASAIDIVLDDGSHIQKHMLQTFLMLWPSVKEGGIYIIEDTHTNYSPEHQESFYGIGLYDYFKGLAERLNIDFIDADARRNRFKLPRHQRTRRVAHPDITREIFSVEFFDSVIAIRKKRKLEPLRIRK